MLRRRRPKFLTPFPSWCGGGILVVGGGGSDGGGGGTHSSGEGDL